MNCVLSYPKCWRFLITFLNYSNQCNEKTYPPADTFDTRLISQWHVSDILAKMLRGNCCRGIKQLQSMQCRWVGIYRILINENGPGPYHTRNHSYIVKCLLAYYRILPVARQEIQDIKIVWPSRFLPTFSASRAQYVGLISATARAELLL